jgi:hypothetical protein
VRLFMATFMNSRNVAALVSPYSSTRATRQESASLKGTTSQTALKAAHTTVPPSPASVARAFGEKSCKDRIANRHINNLQKAIEAGKKAGLPQEELDRAQEIVVKDEVLPTSRGENEAALVDALKASQAAMEALEVVVKMQAETIAKLALENKQLKKAQSLKVVTPKMSDASTEILPGEAKRLFESMLRDKAVQTTSESDKEAPQASPRIQPPVVPPTPRSSQGQVPLGSPRVQVPAPTPSPRIQPPVAESIEGIQQSVMDLNVSTASPYVAEAFRLGWLAGVKSNTMAANRSPSSTRSDESNPSDPGSCIVASTPSDISDAGSNDGSTSPQVAGVEPQGALPPLPAMLPPPPPPVLFSPPQAWIQQLGSCNVEQLG